MTSPIQLSPEQEEILATAEAPRQAGQRRPPPDRRSQKDASFDLPSASYNRYPNSKVVRVTAAAGTGKTTTLLHLAERCARLGHSQITYITFNKAAASGGKARLEQALRHLNGKLNLEARTLHACAMSVLAKARQEDYNEDQVDLQVLGENALQVLIEGLLKDEITAFLQPCFANIDSRRRSSAAVKKSMKMAAEKQVCVFLCKTLAQFCHGDLGLEDLGNPNVPKFKRNYYPIEKFHAYKGTGEKLGFSSQVYLSQEKLGWYPAQTFRLFADLLRHVRTYDLEMKRAQLKKLEIPGTLLLVDECQDMDGCQMSWIADQRIHTVAGGSKLIYLVGDAAQTIYGFRGAKSKFMMEVSPVVKCSLTTSWRFGPNIAKMANVVLFAKENSPQTDLRRPTWQPYRVTGGATAPCRVTADPIDWQQHGKVTIIAWQNTTLFMAALEILGGPAAQEEESDVFDLTGSSGVGVSLSQESVASTTSALIVTPSPEKLDHDSPRQAFRQEAGSASPPTKIAPKFHINGKGEGSGMKKWKQVVIAIEYLYDLYKSKVPMTLPPQYFPELARESFMWDSFIAFVKARELNQYAPTIGVIKVYGDKTMEAVEQFQDEVMNKAYTAEEADVILSTCHAAKGMEWDNVSVCDDFTEEILQVKKCRDDTWEFDIKSWGDDMNMLYVACTRAKRLLRIPSSLRILLEEFDAITARFRGDQDDEPARKKRRFDCESGDGVDEVTDKPRLLCLYKRLNEQQSRGVLGSLIKAFRSEFGIMDDETCVGQLLVDLSSSGGLAS